MALGILMTRAAALALALLLMPGAYALAEQPLRLALHSVPQPENGQAPRWFSAADVSRGSDIYARNCSGCHGERAQGGTLGDVQVPALDGSGHSAHHDLDYLLEQIAKGGMQRGGSMPGFAAVLDLEERRAAIAWVQSLWPEAVYRRWQVAQWGAGHQH